MGKLFEAVDVNHDGEVSYREFTDYISKLSQQSK